MKTLLSIDLSTNCTGWAVFDLNKKTLIQYGAIKGKNIKNKCKIKSLLLRLICMADLVRELIELNKPSLIVIEEITGSKNRLTQKTLDMMHGILLFRIMDYLDLVYYYDVTGANGWRNHLNLRLSDEDKDWNKEAKELNKSLSKDKIPVRGPKHISARYANFKYQLNLDVDQNKTDGDIADAVSMGSAFLLCNRFTNI